MRGRLTAPEDEDDGWGEVGYWTAPRARRQGITTAAVLCTWAFNDLGLDRLELQAAPGTSAPKPSRNEQASYERASADPQPSFAPSTACQKSAPT